MEVVALVIAAWIAIIIALEGRPATR